MNSVTLLLPEGCRLQFYRTSVEWAKRQTVICRGFTQSLGNYFLREQLLWTQLAVTQFQAGCPTVL